MCWMGRPVWQRTLLVKLWPARHFLVWLSGFAPVKRLIRRWYFERDYMVFMPREEAVERKEKIVVPDMVVDYFIEKTSYRFIMDACICREANHCKDYSHDIGCLFMGEAARGINPALGHEAGIEEARALQKQVREAGLINTVGKNRLDKLWLGVSPGKRLLTVCHCCECCCLGKIAVDLPAEISSRFQKIEGLEIKVTDECTGCGTCVRKCFVQAITLENGSAYIGERCRGCGRCVLACPQEAIAMSFAENSFQEKCLMLIEKIEDYVEVE